MAKPKVKKISTNTPNTHDSNTRASKVVLDRHKGKIPKTAPKMKNLQRRSK
jgi:hypothetical protein